MFSLQKINLMKNAEEFYKAWYFITEHPQFMDEGDQTFPYGLDIMAVKVNPETMSIDDDDSKNTKVQIWLEHGPHEKIKSFMDQNVPTHDIDLDCGADTFESAIIELAKLIKKKYGDYEPQKKDA